MKYNIEDKPTVGATFLYGLQWWVVTVPSIITMGLVLGKMHFGEDAVAQIAYMQKLFFVLGLTLIVQVLAGHKLPLVVGPASVLLVGILASLPASVPAIYTAIAIGGFFIVLISSLGLLKYLQKIFTTRVIVVIMMLIPLTLGPTIIKLVFVNGSPVLFNLLFVIVMSILLLLANNWLKGIWKSATLILGIIVATGIHRLFYIPVLSRTIQGSDVLQTASLFITPEFDAGVILAFLFCAIALIINEVGSIEAVGQMLSARDMEKRNKRGVAFTGGSNILAGILGVVGAIDYSSSPGIIASTQCASRFPFIPTALLLIISAFIPLFIQGLLYIPNVVMGTVLLYVMINQFAAGFQTITNTKAVTCFNDGVTMGFPIMTALLISFIPADLTGQIPSLLRPILCNGFVMGIIMVFFMEHIVYRKKSK